MTPADEARAFARGFVRAELAEVLRNPLSRPTGWLILIGTLVNAAAIGSVLTIVLPISATIVVSVLVGAAITVGVYTVTAHLLEARSYARAQVSWLMNIGASRAGGYANRDAQSRLTLYSVWASPRRQGIGTVLLRRIIEDTAGAGEDLTLIAVNRRSQAFYLRLGFQPGRKELLGRRMTLIRPSAAGPAAFGAADWSGGKCGP